MGIFATLMMGVGLSMDASAVAMTNGMQDSKMPIRRALLIGLFFGFFQALMPLIGYFLTGIVAGAFQAAFEKISSWISFGLLAFLGGKMIFEGIEEWKNCKKGEVDCCCAEKLTYSKLFMQAIATSIDALAVGVTLKAIESDLALGIWGSILTIGISTFALSVIAVYIGKAVGNKLADKAMLFGGVVLVAIGLKILIESFI